MSNRNKTLLPLLLVFVIAAGLRFSGLNWGLPLLFNNSETDFVERAMQMNPVYTGQSDFNPHFFDYPSLYIYLINLQQRFYLYLGKAHGLWATAFSFLAHYYRQGSFFYLMGRSTTVLFSLLTIYFTYCLGHKHFAKEIGLWAAFFLAISPLNVYESHLVTADVPVVLFIVLTTYFCLNYYAAGNLFAALAAGGCLGLGVATKYLPVMMLGTLVLAHYLRSARQFSTLLWGLAAVVTAFLLATPYAVIDWPAFLDAFARVTSIMQRGKEGLHYVVKNPVYYLYPLAANRMGWGLLLLCFAGGYRLLRDDFKKALILLFFPLSYLLFISSWGAKYPRYFLPVEPFFFLLAGYFIYRIRRELIVKKWLVAVILGLLVFRPLAGSFEVAHGYMKPDVRKRVQAWIENNISPQKVLIIEDHHTIPVTSVRDVLRELQKAKAVEAKQAVLAHFSQRPVYPTSWLTWTQRYYRLSLYTSVDYILVSTEYINLFEQEPLKYADYLNFYRELKQYARLFKVFQPQKGESGPTIYIYEMRQFPTEAEHPSEPVNEFIAVSSYNLANVYQRFNYFDQAERLYKTSLKINPVFVPALDNLGALYFTTGRFTSSRRYIEKALELDPDDPYALSTLAKLKALK